MRRCGQIFLHEESTDEFFRPSSWLKRKVTPDGRRSSAGTVCKHDQTFSAQWPFFLLSRPVLRSAHDSFDSFPRNFFFTAIVAEKQGSLCTLIQGIRGKAAA